MSMITDFEFQGQLQLLLQGSPFLQANQSAIRTMCQPLSSHGAAYS